MPSQLQFPLAALNLAPIIDLDRVTLSERSYIAYSCTSNFMADLGSSLDSMFGATVSFRDSVSEQRVTP